MARENAAPQETPGGKGPFQFRFEDGVAPAPVKVEVKSLAPELFSYHAQDPQPGFVYRQAAAYHAGTAIAADVDNPARAAETLETLGSGLGVTHCAAGTPE